MGGGASTTEAAGTALAGHTGGAGLLTGWAGGSWPCSRPSGGCSLLSLHPREGKRVLSGAGDGCSTAQRGRKAGRPASDMLA